MKEEFPAAVEALKKLIDELPDEVQNERVLNIRSALAIYTNYDQPEVKLAREKEALRMKNVRISRLEAEIKQLETDLKKLRSEK